MILNDKMDHIVVHVRPGLSGHMLIVNISTGEVFAGDELEFFVDDDTLIGEVFLDGDLIFQSLDVLDDDQLEHALKLEFKMVEEEEDIFSNFGH